MSAYFRGLRTDFRLRLAPQGTPFQIEVWRAVAQVPYGRTLSYARLARRVGNRKAARAVGAANGRNPLPIVIPCHRIVGSHGDLTGYGAGLNFKRQLLDLERRVRLDSSLSDWRRQNATDLI